MTAPTAETGAAPTRRDRLRAVPASRMHLWLMLVLTFTTGINDAVGYLGLDKVFTGNMTGNVVILGMALVGDTGLPVLGPALALLGFMVGAAIAGRAQRTAMTGWSRVTAVLLGLVALVMFGLGAVLLVAGNHPEQPVMVTTTTLAAAAMGMQAAVARHIAVKDVTTVVVTSTITGLAADSRVGAHRPGGTARRVLAIALILLGAAAGALALQAHLGLGLLLAGVLIAAVTVVGELHSRG
ncbi:YoaK family protein [Nocardioides alcanivorans]|uniref:YoaK family protein n=1 Tax=Nocardioides alcanivorans TaxID=2897352 RepID=UPI001F417C03|nr:YoaK family protein [Nocardioides alcanivorans]